MILLIKVGCNLYNVTQYLRTRNRVITILQKRYEGDFLYKFLLFLCVFTQLKNK